jgi:hypothetical protein
VLLVAEAAQAIIGSKLDRAAQDCFALRSQQKAAVAQRAGILSEEITPVQIPGSKGALKNVSEDEHIRADTTIEALAKLPAPFRKNGTVTAGNASGINDGSCAMFVASENAAANFGLKPIARVVAAATAGVEFEEEVEYRFRATQALGSPRRRTSSGRRTRRARPATPSSHGSHPSTETASSSGRSRTWCRLTNARSRTTGFGLVPKRRSRTSEPSGSTARLAAPLIS